MRSAAVLRTAPPPWPPARRAPPAQPLLSPACAGLFSKEVVRRNTVLLYVPSEDGSQVRRRAQARRTCWLHTAGRAEGGAGAAPTYNRMQSRLFLQRPARRQGRGGLLRGAVPCSQVVGYIVYTTHSLAAHIAKLAVREDLRRQGLGRALVQVGLGPHAPFGKEDFQHTRKEGRKESGLAWRPPCETRPGSSRPAGSGPAAALIGMQRAGGPGAARAGAAARMGVVVQEREREEGPAARHQCSPTRLHPHPTPLPTHLPRSSA